MGNKLKPAQILAMHKGPKSKFSHHQVSFAAAQLGSIGGQSGGPARANKLSSKKLSQIASHAANMRWHKRCIGYCPYC